MTEPFDTNADPPQPKGAVEVQSAPSSHKLASESAIWSEFMRRTLADELPGGLRPDGLRPDGLRNDDDQDTAPAC